LIHWIGIFFKANTERKVKFESERKRWHDEMDEQKILHESELDELRNKLRKQRTVDNLTTNQEVNIVFFSDNNIDH